MSETKFLYIKLYLIKSAVYCFSFQIFFLANIGTQNVLTCVTLLHSYLCIILSFKQADTECSHFALCKILFKPIFIFVFLSFSFDQVLLLLKQLPLLPCILNSDTTVSLLEWISTHVSYYFWGFCLCLICLAYFCLASHKELKSEAKSESAKMGEKIELNF